MCSRELTTTNVGEMTWFVSEGAKVKRSLTAKSAFASILNYLNKLILIFIIFNSFSWFFFAFDNLAIALESSACTELTHLSTKVVCLLTNLILLDHNTSCVLYLQIYENSN